MNTEGDLPGGPGKTGDGDGTFLDSLGAENSGNELFKGVESTEQLGTRFLEAHTSLEELRASQVVAPENVEAYVYEFPEGAAYDEADVASFKDVALAQKLTPEAYKAVMDFDQARMTKIIDQQATDAETAKAALVSEMGDAYDANLQLAQRVLKVGGGEDLLKDTEIANHPAMFKFLVGIGKSISEDTLGGSNTPGDKGDKDPAHIMFGDMLAKKE